MIISDNGLVEMYEWKINFQLFQNNNFWNDRFQPLRICGIIMDTIGLVLQRLVVSHDTTKRKIKEFAI